MSPSLRARPRLRALAAAGLLLTAAAPTAGAAERTIIFQCDLGNGQKAGLSYQPSAYASNPLVGERRLWVTGGEAQASPALRAVLDNVNGTIRGQARARLSAPGITSDSGQSLGTSFALPSADVSVAPYASFGGPWPLPTYNGFSLSQQGAVAVRLERFDIQIWTSSFGPARTIACAPEAGSNTLLKSFTTVSGKRVRWNFAGATQIRQIARGASEINGQFEMAYGSDGTAIDTTINETGGIPVTFKSLPGVPIFGTIRLDEMTGDAGAVDTRTGRPTVTSASGVAYIRDLRLFSLKLVVPDTCRTDGDARMDFVRTDPYVMTGGMTLPSLRDCGNLDVIMDLNFPAIEHPLYALTGNPIAT